MKYFQSWGLFCLVSVLFFSCSSYSLTNMGSQLQPEQDGIVVKADTFHLNSSNYFPEYIYSVADSFLLGNYYDKLLGTTRADILAQLACPIVEDNLDSRDLFPENTEVDSVEIYLYYRSFFGSGSAPIELSVYEMNKGTFEYTKNYPTNIPIADYCDKSMLLGKRILKADDSKDSVYSSTTGGYTSFIRMKLSNEFVQRFFDIENNTYHSFENFTNFFKGLYITSDYGSDVMFHVTQIDLNLFYHFTYSLQGKDTTVNSYKTFPANAEVRQVNRFEHPDADEVKERLQSIDSINYISSPANIYTRLSLPMDRLCDTILHKLDGKKSYINSASLKIEVTDIDFDNAALPTSSMLLIKESAIDRFFTKKEALSDTCAIVATISETATNSTTYEYSYSFDLSDIILQELRKKETNGEVNLENLNLLLVPVKLETQSSTSQTVITGVKHEYLMTTTIVKSAQNKTKPMKISLVYSGF